MVAMKHFTLPLIGLLAVCLAVPAAFAAEPPAVTPVDWPQWRGGPQRSGSLAKSAVLAELARGAELVEAWRSEALPAGYGYQNACVVGQGSPVIADGAVYLYVNWPDDTSLKKPTGPRIPDRVNDVVLCVDLATGQTRWKFSAPGKPWRWGIASTPAVAAGAVVFVGSTGDGICLDAATGKERWRWANPEPPKPGYTDLIGPWHASALINDGSAVFVGAGQSIVVCDLVTGAKRWSQPAAGKQCWSSPAAWRRDKGWVLLADGQAWQPADGTVLWQGKAHGWSHGWSTPAIAGDHVAVMGGKGLLVAQLTAAGPRRFAEIELANGAGNAAIADGRVYACGLRVAGQTETGAPKQVSHVVCVDATSGTVIWDTVCPALSGVGGQWSFASVNVAGGIVAVLGNNRLHLLNATDGKVLREPVELDVLKGGVSLALGMDRLVARGGKNLVCYRTTRKATP
jgi:outer membrane protein assembly factor BamB